MNQLLNHLWQSTAFVVVVSVATALLRRNSPRLRYWLWLAASAKFLIPFSLLVATGATVHLPPDSPTLRATTVNRISGYFSPASILPNPASHAAFPWTRVVFAIWAAGALLLAFRWFRRWRTLHLAACAASPLPLQHALPAYASPAMLEPGIFGIFRPVLLVPEDIERNLAPEQLQAILTHESRHLKYRDNLTAAFHMVVETLFWFHPLVWWVGAKLMEERERDCDEAVLTQGSQPGDYARGIVTVCQSYVESPLPCASGISGADLKKRILEIMTWSGSLPISSRGKAMLTATALAAIAIPFAIGIVRAQTLPPPPAYTYDVASIHKSAPAGDNHLIGPGPQGGWRATNMAVVALIATAYGVQRNLIFGAPGWASSEPFDISFTPEKAETAPRPGSNIKEIQAFMGRNAQRLQSVLRDRFGLVLRSETREIPVYNLLQTKGGHRFSPHDPTAGGPLMAASERKLTGINVPAAMLAEQLSVLLDRPVRDETHIDGQYDFKMTWTPDAEQNSPAGGPIFAAIRDQLGLKLESAKAPVQVYVVEKIERPTEN